jgi:eukaryotic-like serine/threonine-protein kinase
MASFDSAVTIPDLAASLVPPSNEATPVDRRDDQALVLRYTLGEKLGEGGMGVVHACRDRRIGRDVALKMVRSEHAARGDLVARFLREACVQGQLEHPAIVPVYDLGRDPEGNVYFTMKRVRGATFEQIFTALREGDEHAARQFSRRKLLTAFASICQALHFAHARGVVHRDLKPGNVMLGDFGEVYLLDWGLAKLLGGPELMESGDSPGVSTGTLAGGRSIHGAAMGTPGYMAPEQVRGDAVDARSDVYALGALLFELLAQEPLHPSGSREAAFSSTLFGPDARPSLRAPQLDLPPELDAICARATALDPRDRFGSARLLLEAIERFLDGDRDMRIRRERAGDHARLAAGHAERALASGPDATEARGRALRDAGRALALDPSNTDAVGTLIRLLTDPPREVPPEALAELTRDRLQRLGTGNRIASRAFGAWFLIAPMAFLMGIRSWPAAMLTTGAWMVAAAVSYFAGQQARSHGKANLPMLLAGAFAIACTTTLFGPYFFLPGFAVIYGMMFVLVPPDRSRRGMVVVLALLAVIVPALLAWTGVIAQPYELGNDRIVIHANMLHLHPLATELFLLTSSLSVVLTACLMTARVHDLLAQAQERLHVQAWQLRQMLPREARVAATDDAPHERSALAASPEEGT